MITLTGSPDEERDRLLARLALGMTVLVWRGMRERLVVEEGHDGHGRRIVRRRFDLPGEFTPEP